MNELIRAILRANCATATCVKIENVLLLQNFLKEQGYHVCLAELSPHQDELETFLQIVSALPMGDVYKRLHPGINLAAFAEDVMDTLAKYPKTALVITNSDHLLEKNANIFFSIFGVFLLQSQAMRPATITTFLVGEGPNFVDKLPAKPEMSTSDAMKYAAKPKKPLTPEEKLQSRERIKRLTTANLKKTKEEQSAREAKMTEEQIIHFRKVIHSMEQSLLNWDKPTDANSNI